MASELAAVYLSIIPETSKIAPGVHKALSGVDKAADASGKSMGSKITAGLGGVLKKSAIGVGASAGAALGVGLTKGLGRLNGIEQAEAKLRGLGHSAQGVGSIMDNALASVKGTAFGLEEAGTAAAGAVAAGIKPGQELERTLKIMGDTATIAGTNLQDMGTIFNSVAARGKLQGDDMLQLLSRGVPVLQLLGEELGKTSEEISDMVSKGQVDFETFQSAMERGMSGAALEAGNTVQGAFKNMGAAAGRLGATIAGPFFRQAAGGFAGVTAALDAMNGRVGPVMADVEAWLVGTAVPAFQRFTEEGKKAWDAFSGAEQARGALASTISALESMGALVAGLAPAVGDLAGAFAKASAALGVSTWDVLVTILDATASILNVTLVPALEAVASLAQNNQGAVTAMVAAWMAFKTVPGIVSKVQPPLQSMVKQIDVGTMSARAMGQDFRRLAPQIGVAGAAMKAMGQQSSTIRNMQNAFIGAGTATQGFAQAVRVGAAPAMSRLQTGAKNVINAMGGPWGLAFMAATAVVAQVTNSIRKQEAAQEALAAQSRATAAASSDMFQAILDGSSQLDAAEQATADVAAEIQNLADNGPGWLDRLSIAINTAGVDTALKRQWRAWRDNADAAKEAIDVMSELEITERDLAAAAMGSEAAYSSMRAQLMESGRGGEYLASQLDMLRESFTSAERAAERLGPAGLAAAGALHDVAEKAGTAEDRANKLQRAFMELAGIELSATEASADLTRVLDSTSNQMDELVGATIGANGAFDATTMAGANAHDTLMDIGDAMRASVTAGNDVNQVFSQSEADLRAVANAAGLTEDQYQALLAAYGLTPEQLVTVAEVQDDAALGSMAQLQSAFKDFDGKPMTTTVTVEDADARQKLEDLGFELSNLDEESGVVDITVDDQEALDKLDRFLAEELPKVDEARAEAHAFLEADGLFATNNLAIAQLATLDLKRPTPLANMDVSRLSAAQIQAMQEVGLLDGQTPTPDAYLNIDQLTAEQQAALAKVFNLDAQEPTPWADMTKEQLDAKGEDALRKLGEIDQTRPNPLVNAQTSAAMEKLGGVRRLLDSLKDKNIFVNIFRRNHGDGNAAGGRFARGGRYRFPAYADGDRHDGYRLPTSGPGTHTTDGFLAFDQDGMPAARLDAGEWIINGRSSEKYDKELKAINAGTFPKLPGYNTGGRAGEKPEDDVDPDGVFDDIRGGSDMPTAADFLALARGEMVNGFQMERPLNGAPYENFPGRQGAWGDCSYTAGNFAAFALGLDPTSGRKFSTVTQLQWARENGMNIGRGPAGTFRMGWYDNGGGQFGHTSSTLPDGTNAEMGGGNGGGALGGGAVPWDHPQFTHHAWAPAGEAAPKATSDGSAPAGTDSDPDEVELSGDAAKAAETVTEAQNDPNSIFYGTGANSWSDLAGNLAKAFVGGQVAAALSVFDIPDELPPLIKAGQTWKMQREEGKTQEQQEDELISAAEAVESADEAAADSAEEESALPPVGDWGEPFFVREISRSAKDKGLDREAAIIGVGTARVESGNPMLMYANHAVPESLNYRHDAIGSDHDSVGLFQQRDNGAWGTVAQRMNAFESAGLFFDVLKSFDWQSMSRGAAAQKVQRSAFPSRYEPMMAGAEVAVDKYGVFDRGGHAYGRGFMPKDVIEPERVLSPKQTKAFDELVYNQLPQLSAITGPAAKGVINAGAGVAGSAANAVVPGSGAAVGAVAAPVAEAVGWYVGQVTDGLQTSVEEFGRDMTQIPRSMVDSLASEFMPGGADRLAAMVPSLPPLAPPAPEPVSTGGGDGRVVNNFNGYDEDWAWSKFRRLESERLGGKVGARG
ncbi:tape measure protein [Corynebacterium freneyi]|uniref:Tape measure domain-containing protein n=1 Tax=Corynebacterium freneyi TaxID=134034 RepID=A0ABS4U9U7_9CORY|nr:tape measure protein [Corynebacterium freneyi]MBP2333288.1 tape measure domain-containing protein [Corynebacterium freneyi]QXA52660.1 tape measure protein [Corynebacterium freneyi]WJZ04608.1 hypothetical protein CFREN_03110 [Corynebacterium freneyi]